MQLRSATPPDPSMRQIHLYGGPHDGLTVEARGAPEGYNDHGMAMAYWHALNLLLLWPRS